MAKINEDVMKMVEQQLARDSGVSGDELFEKAKKLSPEIARMGRRSFHARYPLQVKRKMGAASRRRSKKEARKAPARSAVYSPGGKGARADSREAVRQTLLRFAQDVASASEQPGALVKIVLGVDRYVDQIMRQT